MGGPDSAGDERTFRVNCNDEGASRLREMVKEKLKELDYTEDTLAEYVAVLLRNGRRKDEARRELNVFLGDDSVPFVSWLWEHLSSNLHLYVQPKESSPDKLAKIYPMGSETSGIPNSQPEHVSGRVEIGSENGKEMSTRLSRSRRNREWKGLVQETELFSLRSTGAEISHSEINFPDQPNLVTRSRSSVPQVHKKRSRQDVQPVKRDTASYLLLDAPRRLLQFAVRDAVRTVQQSSSRAEPASKRLCSGVSMSNTNSVLDGRSQRMRSVARVPGLSTALKAAAEAAEDVVKVRYSRGVFDRSKHVIVTAEPIKRSPDTRATVLEDGEYEDFDQLPGSNGVDYYQRSSYDGDSTGNITMLDRDSGIASDSASDNDRYDDVGIVRRAMNVSQSASSANKDKGSRKMKYSVSQDVDEIARNTSSVDEDSPTSVGGKASSKIVNISVSVNTWKPPQYQAPKDVIEVEDQLAVDKNDVSAGKPTARLRKENNTAMAEDKNETARTDVQKESQKTVASTSGSYTTNPSEDIDSRTVFVSNVHFAATKDTLSRHFNKFGEVLKVIIVTDAPTGQPKGSAYVEFLRKESAELALSVNGTSFMSRTLKVVRRSYMNHGSGPMFGWPQASAFASRHTRVPFSRATLSGPFRARLPIKTGARSLQWKRGPSAPLTTERTAGLQNALTSGNDALSPTGRNLTDIRTESKAEGNYSPAQLHHL